MRRSLFSLLFVAAIAPAVSAAPVVPTYGPILGRGATPDKMIIHWGNASGGSTTVSYRAKGSSTVQTANGTSVCMASGSSNCDYEATISGLNVASSYEYAVSGNAIDGSLAFNTCPAAGAPLDVIFYGDSRSGGDIHAMVAANVLTAGADIVFESGDIQVGGVYADYFADNDGGSMMNPLPGFFKGAKKLVAAIPFMAVPGNHDASSNMATNYALLFPNPDHVVGDANWAANYSFVCGSSMFIGLDGNSPSAQTQYVTDRLNAAHGDATIKHVFVWFHQSPFSFGSHGDDPNTPVWAPIFEKSDKLRAVFTGHDHDYQRLTHGGMTYIVSGGAGAGIYPVGTTDNANATLIASAEQYNFVKLHITDSFISGAVFNGLDGTPLMTKPSNKPDTFTLFGSAPDMGGGGAGGSGGGGGGSGGSGGGGGAGGSGGSGGSGGAGGSGGSGGGGGNGATGHGMMGGCDVGNGGGVGAGALMLLALGLLARRRRA